jgi:hypothetical protein
MSNVQPGCRSQPAALVTTTVILSDDDNVMRVALLDHEVSTRKEQGWQWLCQAECTAKSDQQAAGMPISRLQARTCSDTSDSM